MVQKFRKKPVVIEAIQFKNDGSSIVVSIQEFMNNPNVRVEYNNGEDIHILIKTLEGAMKCSINDFIIKGVNGEFYPCKPDIFEKTYEAVID